MRRLALWTLAALALLALFARPAEAHVVGVSRGEYRIAGSEVRAVLTFARAELAAASPPLDAPAVLAGFDVRGDGAACTPALDAATTTEADGMILDAHWTCPRPFARVTIEMKLLASLAPGHRHVVRAQAGDATIDDVLYAKHPVLDASFESAPPRSRFVSFVGMGIEHILTGFDHLLFLLGLVLVARGVRSLVGVVTAFTVAHSITLALAATGVWAPSARIIEPAIALSIAYVGAENLLLRDTSKRWRLAFAFGLVHGFGFAGALRAIALPRAEVPVALVGFNVGVELGQLVVLAGVLPVVALLRQRPWFEARGVKGLSAAIALVGLVWFFQRL
ncbi:MAG: HupE/UreJ family protein [Polyangiaceae bacterium]